MARVPEGHRILHSAAAARDILHVLPDYDAPGVCPDFDADCAPMGDKYGAVAWASCWKADPRHLQTTCPFLD